MRENIILNFNFKLRVHSSFWNANLFIQTKKNLESKRWRSIKSARLPQMWPGFKSRRRRHMWVEFVVGSLLCSERFFSAYCGFPVSSKNNISKFQFDQESGRRRTTPWYAYKLITPTVAAMDSCFVLIGTHQRSIAWGERFPLRSVTAPYVRFMKSVKRIFVSSAIFVVFTSF